MVCCYTVTAYNFFLEIHEKQSPAPAQGVGAKPPEIESILAVICHGERKFASCGGFIGILLFNSCLPL